MLNGSFSNSKRKNKKFWGGGVQWEFSMNLYEMEGGFSAFFSSPKMENRRWENETQRADDFFLVMNCDNFFC